MISRFQQMLGSAQPELPDPEGLLDALEAEGQLETALELLRRIRPNSRNEGGWAGFRRHLEGRAQACLERRRASWHLDPRRRRWRLRYSVQPPATELGPGGLQHCLGELLLALGLPLAMTLAKRPRPALIPGPILPLGMEGSGEWVDMDLREAPAFPPSALPDLSRSLENRGILLLHAEEVPIQASPLLELAHTAHWSWACPPHLRAAAEARLAEFWAASSWEITKGGKSEGQKVMKRVEVRDQVLALTWEGPRLNMQTRLQDGAGMNPQKLLAGILEWSATEVTGLRREALPLSPDPRLAERDRYETRLHNMFEDAVLLEAGAWGEDPPQDTDEDEILRL